MLLPLTHVRRKKKVDLGGRKYPKAEKKCG
jgi:hypothetical protein